ncbi:hypothetical protein PsYK624_063120 [Phanerochaete sordida]|uniref:Uncharacterized protein n=1 Tax=Phanerochaete sordida TaxID=48140 RepID=A0A9P3G8D7_9APHY|nr:hypothetical protein PsYK624_063120 [Phanerochaete sordida]
MRAPYRFFQRNADAGVVPCAASDAALEEPAEQVAWNQRTRTRKRRSMRDPRHRMKRSSREDAAQAALDRATASTRQPAYATLAFTEIYTIVGTPFTRHCRTSVRMLGWRR